MRAPDKDSKRSKRRANRGFVSLEVSSRKHRRALSRMASSCTIPNLSGSVGLLKPGEKGRTRESEHQMTAGGSLRYHC